MVIDLRAVFADHSHALRRSLTRQFGDPALAADLVQDTFVRLAEMPDPASIGDMRLFLGRVARNLALNHVRQVRQRRTRCVAPCALAELMAEQPSAEAELEGRLRLAALRSSLAELPPRTRQVFVLVRLLGKTHAAAARTLRISASSVQKHLARALPHVARHAGHA